MYKKGRYKNFPCSETFSLNLNLFSNIFFMIAVPNKALEIRSTDFCPYNFLSIFRFME